MCAQLSCTIGFTIFKLCNAYVQRDRKETRKAVTTPTTFQVSELIDQPSPL
jgi:hypothetical protein